MKVRFFTIAGTLLLAFGLSLAATAGTIADSDTPTGDDIPDVLDNCYLTPNNGTINSNQRDSDDDGIGDACDCDYTQDDFVLANDISALFTNFNGTVLLYDNTGDDFVLANDVSECFSRFNSNAGD
jgi:hypothetical protein